MVLAAFAGVLAHFGAIVVLNEAARTSFPAAALANEAIRMGPSSRAGATDCSGRWPRAGSGERVAGVVVVAQAQRHACDRPGARPAVVGDPLDQREQHAVELGRGVRGRRPSARCDPIERRRRPGSTGGGRGCGPGRGGGGRRPGRAWRPAPTRAAPPPRRRCAGPAPRSLAAVTGPTPHSRRTSSGWRNAELAVGLDHEQPVGLGHAAGHLGQELGAGHADADRQPDLVAHPRAAAARRCRPARPTMRRRPCDVEERLVDRQPLDQRRGVAEDREHGPAGLGVGLPSGADHDRRRAQAPGLAARPSRCARRGPWPRSWRPAPRPPPTITGRPRSAGSSRCSTDA